MNMLDSEDQKEQSNTGIVNGQDTGLIYDEGDENTNMSSFQSNDYGEHQSDVPYSNHFETSREYESISQENYDKNEHEQLDQRNSLPFPIPTFVVEEVNDLTQSMNSQNEKKHSVPEIEISLVDDTENFTNQGYYSEDETTNERVFVVPLENGGTSMVFCFDSEGGALKGVPQTVL
jgi:hypothetical protein